MKRQQLLARVAAILGALALVAGYVYERAGGELLRKLGLVRAMEPTPRVEAEVITFPGSKSASPFSMGEALGYGSHAGEGYEPTESTMPLSDGSLLPGSKSLIIADPDWIPSPSPPQRVFLSGSKSGVIAEPISPDPNSGAENPP